MHSHANHPRKKQCKLLYRPEWDRIASLIDSGTASEVTLAGSGTCIFVVIRSARNGAKAKRSANVYRDDEDD